MHDVGWVAAKPNPALVNRVMLGFAALQPSLRAVLHLIIAERKEMTVIARETMFAHQAQSETLCVLVEIEAPFEDQPHEWVSTLSLKPLQKNKMEVRGDSSLQAVCLALALAKTLLDDFIEKGGRLTYKNDENFDLNAIFGIRRNM